MWYVIYSRDAEDGLARRPGVREAHLERVRELQDQGRLLVAGPRPAIDAPDPGPAGFHGSLIVARFDSLDDARAWADADPYVAAGVYADVEVTPFIRVLPK
ncbi:YciI family protein [Elongatibacter sediminis]|uniref:YciI family protein n=1 Tax=Elongatibacter sediminis TaxID=3119006 RepID=A0AAW9RD53_9GAMM